MYSSQSIIHPPLDGPATPYTFILFIFFHVGVSQPLYSSLIYCSALTGILLRVSSITLSCQLSEEVLLIVISPLFFLVHFQ